MIRSARCVRRGLVGVIVSTLMLTVAADGVAQDPCEFTRGNVTDETGLNVVDLNDAVDLLGYLFLATAGATPECRDAADVNDNGFVELGDYLFLVNFLVHDGPPPPPPFPDMGVDPTPGISVPDVRDERFIFKIGNAIGFPSNTGLEIPLMITNGLGIEGFQMVFEYDGTALRIDEFRLEETVLAQYSDRSYIIYQFFNRDGVSHAGLSALLNYDPPLSGQTIAPGEDQLVAVIVVGVQLTAEPKQTTRIRFVDGVTFPGSKLPEERLAPIHNFVVLSNDVLRPVFSVDPGNGTVVIETGFIRGDTNQDRRVDISDSVFLLQYLFYGGSAPVCDDAADINNDSKIDIADAIFILNYLFRGSAQPPAPFPAPGLDPEIGNAEVDPLDCDQ